MHLRWSDAPVDRAHSVDTAYGLAEAGQHSARIAEALRIAEVESAELAEAQTALQAQHARLVRARRTLGAVDAWLLALRCELKAETARLTAERARILKALDGVSSEDSRAAALREVLNVQLAAADQALEGGHVRFADMCRASVAARVPRAGAAREGSSDDTAVSDVRRALTAKRAHLTEALERENMRWAETVAVLEEKARSLDGS